jgi:hypothetical protein
VVHRDGHYFFYEDLPKALEAGQEAAAGEWRIHFHVPIYLECFGLLRSSQGEIRECLKAVSDVRHFEVETYAWGVLPAELRQAELAAAIAQEMQWFRDVVSGGS